MQKTLQTQNKPCVEALSWLRYNSCLVQIDDADLSECTCWIRCNAKESLPGKPDRKGGVLT
jgi:hypothetical protein